MHDESQDTVGTQLRGARERTGFSLREIARRAGITPGFLSDAELDRRLPSNKAMTAIAAAIGTDPAPLIRAAANDRISKLQARIESIEEAAK